MLAERDEQLDAEQGPGLRENSDSIVEAVRAIYIEEGHDTSPRPCRVALQA
jgi:hypothetical protein